MEDALSLQACSVLESLTEGLTESAVLKKWQRCDASAKQQVLRWLHDRCCTVPTYFYQRAWCETCIQWIVVCPACGNNACNGGYGTLADGSTCPHCEQAYTLMLGGSLMSLVEQEE